jgi:hypothetical protein
VPSVTQRLSGGDRRSIGAADDVARRARTDSRVFDALVAGLTHTDRLVRMRCADALEKASVHRPRSLQRHADVLVELAQTAEEPELQWHLAQLLARLNADRAVDPLIVSILERYLESGSRIVQVCAVQALADLSTRDPALVPRLRGALRRCAQSDSPALRARASKLQASHRSPHRRTSL